MGIIDSVLQSVPGPPHRAAQGLLDTLAGGVRRGVHADVKALKAVGKYSGATQLAKDTASGVRHPIRRLKGEDAPMRMFNGKLVPFMSGEIPAGPGRALKGALGKRGNPESFKMKQENTLALRDATKGAGEMILGDAKRFSDTLLGSKHTYVMDKTTVMDPNPRGAYANRQTFIITPEGQVVTAKNWEGVHHPDLMEAYEAGGKGTGIMGDYVQGEIWHNKRAGGPNDRLTLMGWGGKKANPAQLATLQRLGRISAAKGVSLKNNPPGASTRAPSIMGDTEKQKLANLIELVRGGKSPQPLPKRLNPTAGKNARLLSDIRRAEGIRTHR